MDLAEQLALHMDDLATEGVRPIDVFCRLVKWGETTIARKGLIFRQDVIAVCNGWWVSRSPDEASPLANTWRAMGESITGLLRDRENSRA